MSWRLLARRWRSETPAGLMCALRDERGSLVDLREEALEEACAADADINHVDPRLTLALALPGNGDDCVNRSSLVGENDVVVRRYEPEHAGRCRRGHERHNDQDQEAPALEHCRRS